MPSVCHSALKFIKNLTLNLFTNTKGWLLFQTTKAFPNNLIL
jgi:hypothetical protein